jgi:mono/diheme cytochrome c family protein
MLSAVASCVTGFLLSRTDDYNETMIDRHQWLGIATAVLSIIAYYLNKKNNKYTQLAIALMTLLIIITGHLGGSITHGSDYLTKAFSSDDKETIVAKRKPIPDVQEAAVYANVVKPILETRCYSCHGPNKQKGKLRLDEPNFILTGGKDGKIIIAGKPDESDLIKRILLPKESKSHMPPIEKPQLSKQDLDLLHWWVSTGADFNKKVKELPQTEKIKPVLLALQSGEVKEEMKLSAIPSQAVEKADEKIIKQLFERGVAVTPVAKNSNYLSANFVAVDSLTEKDLQLLEPLKKQLLGLKLGNTKLTDANLAIIAKLSSLTGLSLERTLVTDKGLAQLKNLLQLQYINLVGTKVTAKGVEQLKNLKNIRKIYLYQTSISGSEWNDLKKVFPKTMIDTGGYKVPMLAGDTSEFRGTKIN